MWFASLAWSCYDRFRGGEGLEIEPLGMEWINDYLGLDRIDKEDAPASRTSPNLNDIED